MANFAGIPGSEAHRLDNAVITKEAAERRFRQGLEFLHISASHHGSIDLQTAIGVVAVMSYLGAYAFPDDNIHLFKQRMRQFLEPVGDSIDVDLVIDQGVDISEVFRRPWTEPADFLTRTI